MKDDEEFGKITIDDQPEFEGWNKPVPYLDTWMGSTTAAGLTQAQREFYQYLKECVKEGKYLSERNVWPYLSLLAKELVKAYKGGAISRRSQVLEQIINLVTVYNYNSYEIDQIVDKEEARIRERRLNSYNKIKDKAIWVPVGQEFEVDGWKLLRGGFYWGKFVEFNPYNTKTGKFGSTTKFEGPAISLIPEKEKARLLGAKPEGFVELNPQQRHSLLSWLAGADEIDIAAMAVYLSGFEVRLFGDKNTPDTERVEDLRYLYGLLEELPIITGDSFKPQDTVSQWITNLIDFTLARYYIDSAETILPESFVKGLPTVVNTRIDRGLSDMIDSGCLAPTAPKAQLIEGLKKFVKPPQELPEVYHQEFYNKLAKEYQNNSRWQFSDYGLVDRSYYKYVPIDLGRQYHPKAEIERLLNVEPIKYPKTIEQVGEKLKLVYARIMRELTQFRNLVQRGAPVLQQINALPGWCDSSRMPGVEQIVQELSPKPEEKFKLMKVSELAKNFLQIPEDSDSADEEMVDYLRTCLYRLGLSMSYPSWATVKLKFDDTTAIYRKSYPEVPSRGTMQTCMFLVAWMIQAEKVTDADYAVIDQWLADSAAGAHWEVSAEAVMRWLISHKLTMTAKRKVKARTLSRYANKRDQLKDLLLVLVNGDGFVLPKRMKRLETIYELIGLDPSTIHSDLHRLAIEGVRAGGTKTSSASSKTSTTKGKKGKKGRASLAGGMINRDKLKEMEQSTARAQEILSQVFIEETKNKTKTSKESAKKKEAEKKKKADSIVTLIEKLALKDQWSRAEFEQLISAEGETYGAMLEKLNDYSYDKVDEALVEDDGDTVYVDTDVVSQLLG